MRTIKKGATSQSLYFEVLDSASTSGGRKTGLAYNTASLTAYYVRNGASATAITLATLAAANSAWSSGGFKEVDATNMPGLYRLDVPDAAFASGAESVVVTIKGASGMVQTSYDVQLVDNLASDVYSRLGAPAGASVSADIATVAGYIDTEVAAIKAKTDNLPSDPADASDIAASFSTVNSTLATIAGYVDTEVAAIKAKTDQLTFTVANQVDVNVVDWKGAAAPAMTGDAYARLGAPAGASVSADIATVAGYIDTEVAAIKAKTDNLPSDPADASDIAASFSTVNATLATIAGYVDTEVAAIKAKTDQLTFTVSGQVDVNVVDWKGSAAPAMTGDAYARLGAPAGASVSADIATVAGYIDTEVAAIKAKTDNLPSDPADASDIAAAIAGLNNLSAAQVKAQADQALADAGVTTTVTGRIDAAISTRLAGDSYTAPDNAGIASIEAKTSNLPSDPADQSLIIAATDAIMVRLGAPTGASISADVAAVKGDTAAVKGKTDSLTFTVSGQVDANIESVSGVTVTGTGASGDPWGPA